MIKLILDIIKGFIRTLFGKCPLCNSTKGTLSCNVCHGFTYHTSSWELRQRWWEYYIKELKKEYNL